MGLPAEKTNGYPQSESNVFLSSDGLAVHMRIPADRIYVSNAILTLREICEHVAVSVVRANRIVLAMEEALLNAIEHAYQEEDSGQIDVQFSVAGSELSLTVEDSGCGMDGNCPNSFKTDEEILCDRGRGLSLIHKLPDRTTVDCPRGRGTRASMLFYLNKCD
jgi:serine/threonine-protein kinase RsbW